MSELIGMLISDHDHVRSLLDQVLDDDGTTVVGKVLDEIGRVMQALSSFEESELYPALLAQKNHSVRVLEAYEEHRQITTLMTRINDMDGKDEMTAAQVLLLADDIRGLFAKEEAGIFPLLETQLPPRTVATLTDVYRGYRRDALV